MGNAIGSAALVLTANAQKLYAGLDAAQAKVRTFAAKAAATPVNMIGKMGKFVMPALNIAKKGVTLPFSLIAKGGQAIAAVGGALAAVAPYALAGAAAIGVMGLAAFGLYKGAEQAAEVFKKMSGSLSFSNGQMLKPEQLAGVRLALKSWENAQQSIEVMWEKIAVALAPVVTMLGEFITDGLAKLEPYIMAAVDGFSELVSIGIIFASDLLDGILQVIDGFVKWFTQITGIEGQFKSMGEVVRAVLKGIAKAGAYAWDVIKVGVGAVAIAIGFIVEQGFSRLIGVFADLVGLMKELPDELRPAGLDRFIAGVERTRDAVRDGGKGMREWGKRQIDSFGQSAAAVDAWFDNVDNRQKQMIKNAAARQEAFKPLNYTAVGAAVKNSKEAWSIEAKFKTEGQFRQQQIDQQQLQEQRRANALLNDVRAAVENIRFPAFGLV